MYLHTTFLYSHVCKCLYRVIHKEVYRNAGTCEDENLHIGVMKNG